MKRREFIALLGSATAWPLAARAQQPAHTRRIGVLSPFAENDFRSAGQSDGVPASLVSLMAPISKANRIETGERPGGIGEICSVEVDEK
jgi:hypothetical protein